MEPTIIPQQAPATRIGTADRWIIGFSAFGALCMAYLTYVHYKTTASSFCNFGAGFSCDLVNKSTYAEIAGIPVSILGLGFFVSVAVLAWKKFLPEHLRVIHLATIASLVFSAYLTGVEIFLLDSICVFCEASKLAMLGILVVTARAIAKAGHPPRWDMVVGAAAAGGVMIFLARALML